MTEVTSTIDEHRSGAAADPPPWYARTPAEAVTVLGTDPERGLDGAAAADRLHRLGPNRIAGEKPPSTGRWRCSSCAIR
jgi:Ca2+-transporting ATPase